MKTFRFLPALTAGLVLGLFVFALGQDYRPGKLYVTFQQGVVDSLHRNASGNLSCGISYIDSVNLANDYTDFSTIGCVVCLSTKNDYIVSFPDSADLFALSDAYLADPGVLWARPDYIAVPNYTPNDSFFLRGYVNGFPTASRHCRQWALDSAHCDFEKAWDITRGDTSVVIGIFDLTNMMISHADLSSQFWINSGEDINNPGTYEPWWHLTEINGKFGDIDGVDNDLDYFADNVIGLKIENNDCFPIIDGKNNPGSALHATRVASIAGAATDNQVGVAGGAFKSKIMFIQSTGNSSDLVSAMCYIRESKLRYGHPDVINMSFGYSNNCGFIDPGFEREINLAYDAGIVMVAAAGNNDNPCQEYPAFHPRVISVTGVDTGDAKPSVLIDDPTYNSGVDLSAPMHHWACDTDRDSNNYFDYCFGEFAPPACPIYNPIGAGCKYGTSYSAPLVASVVALLKSAYPSYKNDIFGFLTYDRIMEKLKGSTDSIYHKNGNFNQPWQNLMGTGRLNAFKALTFFGNIPNATNDNDTTLSGTIYVSGDIRVRAGKTLRLAAGTVLRFYPGDVMKAGVDIGKTEIVVDSGGVLEINGTPGNPVKFLSFRREDSATTNDWRGIIVKRGGKLVINHAVIRHAYAGIEYETGVLAADTIKNVHIARCQAYGIRADSTPNLVILNCGIDSVHGSPGGYGIYVSSPTAAGAKVKKDTVRTCFYGMFIGTAAAAIESCLILGSSGALTSNTGIYNQGQGLLDPPQSLSVSQTTIQGHFSSGLFHNFSSGRVHISFGNFVSSTSPRSPYIVINTAGANYAKVRNSRLVDWGDCGGDNGAQRRPGDRFGGLFYRQRQRHHFHHGHRYGLGLRAGYRLQRLHHARYQGGMEQLERRAATQLQIFSQCGPKSVYKPATS